MSYFLQPKRVKYRITLVIVGSLLEVTTSPTSPELTIVQVISLGLTQGSRCSGVESFASDVIINA
ncbi:hypothetical protein [Candidatus Tisiphia endosymbiont of Sialis lutaria]|uniref:hypothetical protein n=1 Tax=Candidatus Tisiphia endosymbiont of Sialis lutaria TaxID=2029164 RepID=UPI00312CA4E7